MVFDIFGLIKINMQGQDSGRYSVRYSRRKNPQGISGMGCLASLSAMLEGVFTDKNVRWAYGTDIFQEPPEADLRGLLPPGSLDLPPEGEEPNFRKRFP